EDGIRDRNVTGVQTCALPISVQRELRDVRGWFVDEHELGHRRDPMSSVSRVVESLRLRDLRDQLAVVARHLCLEHDRRAPGMERSEERRVGKECRGGGVWEDL